MIACFSYVIHLSLVSLWPEIGSILTGVIVIPAATGEHWMVFYPLIRAVCAFLVSGTAAEIAKNLVLVGNLPSLASS